VVVTPGDAHQLNLGALQQHGEGRHKQCVSRTHTDHHPSASLNH
jgi:hypothetical protein